MAGKNFPDFREMQLGEISLNWPKLSRHTQEGIEMSLHFFGTLSPLIFLQTHLKKKLGNNGISEKRPKKRSRFSDTSNKMGPYYTWSFLYV